MTSDNIDALLEEAGGCGRFQLLFVFALWAAELSCSWSMMMMSFGSYNPGMECVTTDFNTLVTGSANNSATNFLSTMSSFSFNGSEYLDLVERSENLTIQYLERNSSLADNICDCPGKIKFKSSASTIVTEWNLVCDKVWISSIIISVQMAGVFLGCPLGGELASRFGRKIAVYGSLVFHAILNCVTFFSVSWTMFAVLRFFIGMAFGTVLSTSFVYCSEFLTHKWRGILSSIPDWSVCGVLLALSLMALRDWRYLHMTIAALSLLACLPALWVPESMRWLAVRGKVSKASKAAVKMASTNKKPQPKTDILLLISQTAKQRDDEHKQPHRYVDLFRGNLRKTSIVMSFVYFTLSAIFYGVGFGISALSGNFYINFLALNLTNIPTTLTGAFAINKFGRRLSTIIYFSLAAVACVCIVIVHFLVAAKEHAGTAITVFAIICYTCISTAWGVCQSWVVELYPTTIRSLAYSWVAGMARIGGIVSPYMLPKGTIPVYGSFSIMGFLILFSILSVLCVPETKGKPLQDTVLEITFSGRMGQRTGKTHSEDEGLDNCIHGDSG